MVTPIDIVDYVDDQNLVQVSWNQRFLEDVKKLYKLKHQQAVLFANKAKDRFRLVACFYDLAVLILPPVDPERRLSLYLLVSQFLRRMHNTKETAEYVDSEIEMAKQRIERRAKIAADARKRRRRK